MRLVKVDGPNHKATFQNVQDPKKTEVVEFAMLHVVPYMKAPNAISQSKLSDKTGFVDVDKHTLQHKTYKNVFCAGDSSNLPTSKTMAAIAKQVPILVHNLLSQAQNRELTASYDGYTSCPITTARNQMLLAEFRYNMELAETFPEAIQNKPRQLFMFFKETLFPFAYWNFYLPGRWYGPRTLFPPRFPRGNTIGDSAIEENQ